MLFVMVIFMKKTNLSELSGAGLHRCNSFGSQSKVPAFTLLCGYNAQIINVIFEHLNLLKWV